MNDAAERAVRHAACWRKTSEGTDSEREGRFVERMLMVVAKLPIAGPQRAGGAVALAEAPPQVARRLVMSKSASYRAQRKTLTIRHVSGHRVVALVEIVSPANKDRPQSVEQFVAKILSALRCSVHVLVLDLFRPGPHDPRGIHEAIGEFQNFDEDDLEIVGPYTFVSYMADELPEVVADDIEAGASHPDMTLFIDQAGYINLPLETTYQAVYRGLPEFCRRVIEGDRPIDFKDSE